MPCHTKHVNKGHLFFLTIWYNALKHIGYGHVSLALYIAIQYSVTYTTEHANKAKGNASHLNIESIVQSTFQYST